jgi:hypothetical protein
MYHSTLGLGVIKKKKNGCRGFSPAFAAALLSPRFFRVRLRRTRLFAPETRNPKSETRNPKPKTRNVTGRQTYLLSPLLSSRRVSSGPDSDGLAFLHPKSETRNPKPETQNPKAETSQDGRFTCFRRCCLLAPSLPGPTPQGSPARTPESTSPLLCSNPACQHSNLV